jgi:hypothetical protein
MGLTLSPCGKQNGFTEISQLTIAIEDQASVDGGLDSLIPYRNIVLGPAETDLEIVVFSNELQDCCSTLVRLAHWGKVTTRGSTDSRF